MEVGAVRPGRRMDVAPEGRDEARFLAAAVEAVDAPIIVLDPDGRIVLFNAACCRITGYSAQEVRGRPLWDFLLPPDEAPAVRAVFARLTAGHFPDTHENDWLTRTGDRRRIAWTNTAVLGPGDEVRYVLGTGIDVTDRRRVEAELRVSMERLEAERARRAAEARFASIVSIAADAIITLDARQRIASFNEGAERMFGWRADEVVGRSLSMLIPPRFREAHDGHVERFRDSGTSARRMGERRDIFGLRRDGEEFPAEASIAQVGVDGERSFAVVLRDITDRVEMTEALREREEAIRELYQATSAGDRRLSDKIEDLLAMGRRRFGLDVGVLARVVGDRYEVVAAQAPEEGIRPGEVYELGDTYCSVTLRADGPVAFEHAAASDWRSHPCYRRFQLEAYLAAPVVVDGRVFGTLNFSSPRPRPRPFAPADKDLLRLMALWVGSELQRERASQAQRFLADTGRDLASSLDYHATLDNVARAAVPWLADCCIIFGIEPEGRLRRLAFSHVDPTHGVPVGEVLPGTVSDDPEHPVLEAIRTGEARLVPRVPIRPSWGGAETPFPLITAIEPRSLMAVPLTARGKRLGALALVSTESGRVFGEEDLALASELGLRAALALDNAGLYAEAKQAVAAREHMMSILSHDLRNPLVALTMVTDMLEGAITGVAGTERALQQLRMLDSVVGEMERLIGDLLDVGRMEAGGLRVDPEIHGSARLVREALDLLAPLVAHKKVRLETDLPEGLPLVLADGARIKQVFSNLVGNALSFSPVGGTIRVAAAAGEGEVHFTVADEGPGIPADVLPHIFDRYWQAKQVGRSGAGLGLAISRGIVEAHGGRIWADGVEGRGAVFHFTLPSARE